MAKTYREVLFWASSFLEDAGIDGSHILYVFLGRKKWSKTDWLLNWNREMPEAEEGKLKRDLEKLKAHYPPQYLLGFEEFYGRMFKVTEDTLIPRPETEELVALCLAKGTPEAAYVVDVGTGTGAISITLKLERPVWQIATVDLSQEALNVAQENATKLGAELDFYLGDTLSPIQQPIDILISNPPYIGVEEWEMMDESVRTFEPKMALFAENHGLAIYEQLAKEASQKLAKDGKIFLEIGYLQGKAVRSLFQTYFPHKKVSVHQDLSGQDRMVVVE